MIDYSYIEWEKIEEAVRKIVDEYAVSRFDFDFPGCKVLVYRAGTIVRVDFKEDK